MSPLIVGIARGGLVGSAFPESVFSQTICSSEDTSDGINFCQQFRDVGGSARSLAPGELFSWTGELYLAAGDYWLYASLEGDALMGAGWYVNDEFMRDDLAFRSCALGFAQGQGCSWQNTTWASVADFGPQTSPGGALQPAGSYAAPIARIQFDPGVRVPEPETLALFGLGLAGLAFAGRRKLN